MTSFKAQGITVENVLIYHDSTQRSSNTRNKIYVDVIRAKTNVKIYTDVKTALKRQAKHFQKKITRDTFSKTKKSTLTLNKTIERNIKHEQVKAR